MIVELTRDEAQLLIAVLTGAEGAIAALNPSLMEVLVKDLRRFRSALLEAYLRDGLQANDAAARALTDDHEPSTRA